LELKPEAGFTVARSDIALYFWASIESANSDAQPEVSD
jgi:hypothetical protein